MTIGCVPVGSLPDQLKVTPFPHEPPGGAVIACGTVPTVAVTPSARNPSEFRNTTEIAMVVAVVPVRGETTALDSVVLLGAAAAMGVARAASKSMAAATAPIHAHASRVLFRWSQTSKLNLPGTGGRPTPRSRMSGRETAGNGTWVRVDPAVR